MKAIVLFAGLALLSCERDHHEPKPGIKPPPVYYSYYIYGNGQISEAGLSLPDSMGIQIWNYYTGQTLGYTPVKFKILSGGGTVDDDSVITSEDGRAFTHWKLGTASHKQVLRATFNDGKDSVLHIIDYEAYGYRTGAWDTNFYIGLPSIESILVDTLRNQSYGINNTYNFPNGLYSHGERYYDWVYTGTPCDYGVSLNLDRDGNIFMYRTYGGITVSNDQGKTWSPVNPPEPLQTPGNYQPIRLYTENSILWIYITAGTLYRSADMGASWSADTAGFGRFLQLTHLTGHPGGSVFVLIDGRIHKSADNGLTWKKLKQMALYIQMAGNNLIAIDTDGNILKSSDFGESFTRIMNHYPNCLLKYTSNMIAPYKGTWYVAVSGYGLKSTKDFNTFEDIFYFPKIRQVRIDNVGTIRVVNNRVDLFYKSSEP